MMKFLSHSDLRNLNFFNAHFEDAGYYPTDSKCDIGGYAMYKMQVAYLLKDSNMVVIDKKSINNTKDSDYEEVTIAIPLETIKNWSAEVELMGLDEEEDF